LEKLMTLFCDRSCTACRADAPKASPEQIQEALAQLPEWKIIQVDGVDQLQRIYRLKNFAEAMSLTQAIGLLAEEYNHHPALLTEWGKVTVTWWTHKIKGLHENDLVMAAKTDRSFEKFRIQE
jgi:4a-hydroxytetrahydrobiopterin dehydratase